MGKDLTIKISMNVSADCTEVDSELKIEVTSKLPVHHGTTVAYRCSRKHSYKRGHVNATCQDGTISFTGQQSPCFKIGTASTEFMIVSEIEFNFNLLKCKNRFFLLREQSKQFLHFKATQQLSLSVLIF